MTAQSHGIFGGESAESYSSLVWHGPVDVLSAFPNVANVFVSD